MTEIYNQQATANLDGGWARIPEGGKMAIADETFQKSENRAFLGLDKK